MTAAHSVACEWSKAPNSRCRCQCGGLSHGVGAVRQRVYRVLSDFLEADVIGGPEMSSPTDRDGAPLSEESDRKNLLDHLEEAMTLGHGFRFEPWRDSLPMGALLDIHEQHHQAEANHPEGFHSHEREIP